MPRAMICVDVNTESQAAVGAWLAEWRDRLTFCSDNEGCGCCVDTYRIEGDRAALDSLPPDVTCLSEWSGFPPAEPPR